MYPTTSAILFRRYGNAVSRKESMYKVENAIQRFGLIPNSQGTSTAENRNKAGLSGNPFKIPEKINPNRIMPKAVANSGENCLLTIPLSLINKNVFVTGSVGNGKTTSAILHGFKRKQRISF